MHEADPTEGYPSISLSDQMGDSNLEQWRNTMRVREYARLKRVTAKTPAGCSINQA